MSTVEISFLKYCLQYNQNRKYKHNSIIFLISPPLWLGDRFLSVVFGKIPIPVYPSIHYIWMFILLFNNATEWNGKPILFIYKGILFNYTKICICYPRDLTNLLNLAPTWVKIFGFRELDGSPSLFLQLNNCLSSLPNYRSSRITRYEDL